MTTTDMSFNAEYQLTTLQEALSDAEVALGTIVALGNKNGKTGARFDDASFPATRLRLRTLVGGKAPLPGAVTEGTVFIIGQKIGVAAYRQ
jgi:hypothetical protein